MARKSKPEAFDTFGTIGTIDTGEVPRAEIERLWPAFTDRYEVVEHHASGGMGDVWRVRDVRLDRILAAKVLPAAHSQNALDRFEREANTLARLDHPAIVGIIDVGTLEDGRPWFTMPLVLGSTLDKVIISWRGTRDERGLRRHLEALRTVSLAIAHAHERGVVHRDVKPANIILGRHGEVRLIDWGIAKVEGLRDLVGARSGLETQVGTVIGTQGFLAPEQASGDPTTHGPPSDVYALGATLYNVLSGRPPHRAGAGAWPGPKNLSDLLRDAMAASPRDRPTAVEFADVLAGHLDGAYRAELAKEMVHGVQPRWSEIREMQERARVLDGEAHGILGGLAPHADSDTKRPGWKLEDKARRLRRRVALARSEQLQALHGALNLDATCVEAHEELADLYAEDLQEAERRSDRTAAAVATKLLEKHDTGRHEALLRGLGHLELDTEPSGVRAVIQEYREIDRRLQPYKETELGRTPISVDLPAGSFVVTLRREGHEHVRYPVTIRRGAAWVARTPIPLPDVPPEWCYVPAGPFLAGGDDMAPDGSRAATPWLDGFLIRRTATTIEEYLPFAQQHPELVTVGPEELRFEPILEEDGVVRINDGFEPRFPMGRMTWAAATAFAAWSGARLPTAVEYEKAARGVDGRHFSWGNHPDVSFTAIGGSRTGPPRTWLVGTSAFDESPYGARDLCGNSRTWCQDTFAPNDDSYRVLRGGSRADRLSYARTAARFAAHPERRMGNVGIRLVRSLVRFP